MQMAVLVASAEMPADTHQDLRITSVPRRAAIYIYIYVHICTKKYTYKYVKVKIGSTYIYE